MKILLYYHTGSKNHGCEAIVRTICSLFKADDIVLYSFDIDADKQFDLDKIVKLKKCETKKKKYSILERIKIRLHLYQEGQECFYNMLKEENVDWAFAIGGDNYCYLGQPQELSYINREFHKRNVKTALVGCSINEEIVSKKDIQIDLERYDFIIARESLTYGFLKKNGIKNVHLFPDTAFILPNKKNDSIIDRIDGGREYVGINLSPLISKGEKIEGIVYQNFVNLIYDILNNTDYSILLIPHVFVSWDNDVSVLNKLYDRFKDSNRIFLIEEEDCSTLKWYVARCRFVVCARTHVSIAAYSQNIPTLVVGYSVKSEGIAKDLFGTYENYVIPSNTICNEYYLIKAFKWIERNEKAIIEQLENKNKSYKEQLAKLPDKFIDN